MLNKVYLEPGQRLTKEQIAYYVDNFPKTTIQDNNNYFKGDNPTVLSREQSDKYDKSGTPNEMIPLPYARKIVTTISGYMLKPGYITYNSENGTYMEAIRDILDYNNESLKTNQIGEQLSIQGSGYELHWIENAEVKKGLFDRVLSVLTGGNSTRLAVPRFAKIPADEIICLYDYSIEPDLIVAIRFYDVNIDVYSSTNYSTIKKIDVYYKDRIEHYQKITTGNNTGNDLTLIKEEPNFYGIVPVVHYWNNEELLGDFEPVKKLIDAYDNLCSDSMNEFDKFADCYMRLVGMTLADQDKDKVKQLRLFEGLTSADAVSFLTKDINTEFLRFMTELVRAEIHKQSHVPDFADEKFAGDQSGVSLKYKLFDFENLAAKKEAYFKRGLMQRFRLITAILGKQRSQIGEAHEIEISFKRNLPVNVLEIADVSSKSKGIISDRSIMKMWPADIVKDPDEELEQIKKENENKIDMARFMVEDKEPEEDEPEEEMGDNRMMEDGGANVAER